MAVHVDHRFSVHRKGADATIDIGARTRSARDVSRSSECKD
jgi:hypothetical protein